MAELSFKNIIISFILVSLFFLAMISFGIQLQSDNPGINETLSSNKLINTTYARLHGNLTDIEEKTNESRAGFEKDIDVPSAFLSFDSLRYAGRAFTTSIVLVSNILFGFVADFIGIDPIVIATISAIIIIVGIFMLWRTLKAGY